MKRNLKDGILFQPIKVKNYSEFFAELGKAALYGFTAQYNDAIASVIDAIATVELEDTENRLAWDFVNRSVMRAIADLVKSNQSSIPQTNSDAIIEKIKNLNYERDIKIDTVFFKRPKESQFVKDIQEFLREWLASANVEMHKAEVIIQRFPSFFLYSLHDVWGGNSEKYKRLFIETPFSDAVAAEEEWGKYKAYLEKETQEGVFGEFFSLQQIFVPLCAYHEIHDDKNDSRDLIPDRNENIKRHVIDLETYMREWLNKDDKKDAIRIISGGPGSGKSSFAKMFAASISATHDVLFVPLYKLDLRRDVKDVVGEFLVSNRFFSKNPIGESESLLIIFDGLDEVAQQGKASLNAASDFVTQTANLLHNHNDKQLRIRIIITGRELSVQASIRKKEQILHVLPYYVPADADKKPENKGHIDLDNLLKEDKRDVWWKTYGDLTDKKYKELPKKLKISALDEVTAQPLLNYLLALSYERGKIKFSDDTNLNELYEDLVNAVYEREYQSPHRVLVDVSSDEYHKVLEEVAVATWQGSGRTATLKAIEERCERNKLKSVLEKFQKIAEDGVTNLLTAFYFRESGIPGADKTFEFTHKSFGEYLAAKRIVRQLQKTKTALEQDKKDQTGWTHEVALENWISICSSVAIDRDIFKFLCDEVRQRETNEVKGWQDMLCELISYMMEKGMPFEKIPSLTFLQQTRQSRNSEEALLAALSACSRYTDEISEIQWPENTSAGEWFSKLCGQRTGPFTFLGSILNHLDLSGCCFDIKDFYGTDLIRTNLTRVSLYFATLRRANLAGANLLRAGLLRADLEEANLQEANLREANLHGANLREANLREANLEGANLEGVKGVKRLFRE